MSSWIIPVPTCIGTTWRQLLFQNLTWITTFRQTRPALWRRSTTTGTATIKTMATAPMDQAWTRWNMSITIKTMINAMTMCPTMTMCLTMTIQLTMTYITFTGWLSYAGCYPASLSSAIASLIGAPRILQVLNKQWFLYHFWSTRDCNYPISILMNYILVSGCGEGRDLPWYWLVWKRWQRQQRSNPRLVLNCLCWVLDKHFSQVTSYVLPLPWALWWLPIWMWSELLPQTSSLPGGLNVDWYGYFHQWIWFGHGLENGLEMEYGNGCLQPENCL